MSVTYKSKELFCSASMIYFCSHNIVSIYLQTPCTTSRSDYANFDQNLIVKRSQIHDQNKPKQKYIQIHEQNKINEVQGFERM